VRALAVGAAGAGLLRLPPVPTPGLVRRLAALHTGHLGDDVAWLLAGVALLGGMVAWAAPS
jgi:hypothetical protein